MTATITDFNHFTGLRAAANQNDPAALREVASQFEALFLQTMLKTMREASLGDPIFGDSDQQEMYQGMMDQQLALEMASGRGVGLADMLVRQLGGADAQRPPGRDRGLTSPDTVRGYSLADRQAQGNRDYSLSKVARRAFDTPLQSAASAGPVPQLYPSAAAPPEAPLQSPALPSEQLAWSDPKSFVRDIWPHAERAARRLNVAPEAIVAQAALETGWGAHVMSDERGNNSFNLFGIKAGGGWQGDQVSRQTLEFENGVPVRQTAKFRSYKSVAEVFRDYTDFLVDNPRYSKVHGHGNDVAGFANALQSAGYATDPKYADKITSVLNSPTMRSVIRYLKNSVVQPITSQLSLRSR